MDPLGALAAFGILRVPVFESLNPFKAPAAFGILRVGLNPSKAVAASGSLRGPVIEVCINPCNGKENTHSNKNTNVKNIL